MKYLITLFLALCVGVSLCAQEADSTQSPFLRPDYAFFENACADSTSDYYYPKLAARFAQVDTSMTMKELQAFYYGQVFQPSYSPYGGAAKEYDAIRAIMGKEEEPTRQDFDSIVLLAEQHIAKNPADPMAYYYKFIGLNAICQNLGGDTVERSRAQEQFQMLFYAIEASGNGMNVQDAFYVVSTAHEYMMLNLYGFDVTGQALISEGRHSYDLMFVDENQYGVDSLYFNIDPVFYHLSKVLFGDESPDFDPKKKVTSIELPIGTKFVLELVKTKRQESTFRIVAMEKVSDTLMAHDPKLFADPIAKGQMVGYFAPTRLSENSSKVFNCLIFKSNAKKDMLFMDTEIRYGSFSDYESTSNSGIPRGPLMNEMWPNTVKSLRISNIRTQEKKP